MSITDEELAQELHAAWRETVKSGSPWDALDTTLRNGYFSQARVARWLLCPTSPEELRMERGKAAYEALRDALNLSRQWEQLEAHTQESYCKVADAVLVVHERQQSHGQ